MLWIFLATLQLYAGMASAKSPITISVDPRFGYAPLTISGRILIESNEQNRGYCVYWESPDGQSGLSCKPLEGAESRKTYYFEVKNLPAGSYDFIGVLQRPSGFIESPVQKVEVLSRF